MSPLDLGGAPAVMPSNDWWKTGVGAVLDYNLAKLARRDVATPAGVIIQAPPNPPPGGFGLFTQAASVPGAQAQAADGVNRTMLLVGIAVVLGVVLVVIRMRR